MKKKINAEVSTPLTLAISMLDKIPSALANRVFCVSVIHSLFLLCTRDKLSYISRSNWKMVNIDLN